MVAAGAEAGTEAAPASASLVDARSALDASLAEADRARVALASLVAVAAPSADAEATRLGVGVAPGERDAASDPDACARVVDAGVTRLAASRRARDACVAQIRVEGALREARDAIAALESAPRAAEESPADPARALALLESAADALRAATDALLESDVDASSRAAEAASPRASMSIRRRASSRRFRVASARAASALALRLRRPAESVLETAAAATGWPPPSIAPSAVAAFEWPLASDDVADPDATFPRAARVAAALRVAAETARRIEEEDAFVDASDDEDDEDDSSEGSPRRRGDERRRLRGDERRRAPVAYPFSPCWVASALAAPVASKLRDAFGKKKEKGLAVAAERPEALFACAGTLVEALAPLARERVRDALLRDGGRGELPRLDDEALAAFFKKTSRRPDPDVFGSSLAASFCAALSAATTAIVRDDVLPATLANDATTTGVHADVPWLHLADECEAFDARVRAAVVDHASRADSSRAGSRAGGGSGGSAFSDARRSSSSAIADATARVAVVAHRYSAFAALATTAPRVTERWFAAERADGLRAVDAACDAPDDRGWRPEGAGVANPEGGPGGGAGYEDPLLDPFGGVVLSDSGDEGDHGVEPPRARFPAAEAAADALRRFCARAEAMPLHATCARDGLVDALDRLGGGLDSLNKARSSPRRGAFGGLPTHFAENDHLNARFAYLSSAAFPLAEAFARRVRARASARDALPALPLGDGRAASLRVGACVASARVAADALSRLGEDAAVMQCAGADAFGEAAAAFDDDAEAWTRRLADAAADAFADAAAYYEGGAHVATFGREDEAEGSGEERDEGEEGQEGEEGDGAASKASKAASPSALLAAPLDAFRERLRHARDALAHSPDGRLAAAGAARRALRLVADRFLREIVLFAADGAGFGAKGAERFRADVAQLCAAARPFGVRAPEAAAARLVDAARLLTLEPTVAARFASACDAVVEAEMEGGGGAVGEGALEGKHSCAAEAALEALREETGVHATSARDAIAVLRKRRSAA